MIHRVALLSLSLLALPTFAHEFIGKPARMTVTAGQPLAFSLISSHKFMTSEELEDANDVKIEIYTAGNRTALAFAPSKDNLSFEGKVDKAPNGTFMLLGRRTAQIWANTPDGVKRDAGKLPGATNVRLIEKYSKALVNVSATSDEFAKEVGDKLEIVALTNPAKVKVGDEMTVKILYKGKPLTTNVWATYDSFSNNDNTYAYFTEGLSDGTAKIKLKKPVLWMVRVEHSTPEVTADYARYVGRAVLVFNVK